MRERERLPGPAIAPKNSPSAPGPSKPTPAAIRPIATEFREDQLGLTYPQHNQPGVRHAKASHHGYRHVRVGVRSG